jgi:hypothetical protein
LQGGADFKLTRALSVGPFVDLSWGRYTGVTVDGERIAGVPGYATHEWLTIGAKGTFGL